jgi:plastocyanin
VTSVRTPPIAFALVALAVIAVSGCGSSTAAATGDGPSSTGTSPATTPATTAPGSTAAHLAVRGQIDIVDYDFSPTTITVRAGEQVVWLNEDAVDHWVISAPGTPQPFDLGRQGSAASASRTFDTKGHYPYFCNLHNYMKGEVVVQ